MTECPGPDRSHHLVPVEPSALDGVDLDSCDAEPIHTPGHVQAHGMLLAFDDGLRLRNWSVNAVDLLGRKPVLLLPFDALVGSAEVAQCVREVQAEAAGTGFAPLRMVEGEPGADFDVLVHAHAGRVMVEFERSASTTAPAHASFLTRAHRVLGTLRHQSDIAGLLDKVAEQVRAVTGFDRVMCYRFLQDESGEVMAEARRDDLESLLGMRYPASDIPAQARRLYILSTLRLIADVDDPAVPVLGHPDDPPLDMSFGALRSVSPIHIEYLRNMGVRASMSISIVLDGRLWGLIACHHYAPLRPPYAVRAVCDLLAQTVAAQVARLDSASREAIATRAAIARDKVAAELQQHEDLLAGFEPVLPDIAGMLGADALMAMHNGRFLVHGDISPDQARAMVEAMPDSGEWIERDARAQWPESVQDRIGPWVGVMALAFDVGNKGWILALRTEQERTVRWGGAPDKQYVLGPRGPRLSPRGSFAEWRETVHGASAPWAEAVRIAAHHLLTDLQRESLSRHADVERARTQMMAMLSHDLSDPLHAIRMAAGALERATGGEAQQRIGARIRTSSGRMQRLVTHMLDFSRIRSGRGLDIRPVEGDLVLLLADLVDEIRVAHPGSSLMVEMPAGARVRFDADRLAQAIGNLVSNARLHGDPLQAVALRLQLTANAGAVIEVRNPSPPLPSAVVANLFQAFKRQVDGAPQRKGHQGLGLGLFIAHRIAAEHGGALAYRHEDPDVVFTLTLPA